MVSKCLSCKYNLNSNKFAIFSMFRYHGYAMWKSMSIGWPQSWPSLLRNHSNEEFHIRQAILILIVFSWWTFWDHCQQNWSVLTCLTCLTPVEPKFWPLNISSITTKQYVVDRSNNFILFLNRYNKKIMVFDNIEGTFYPSSNYFVTPRLPVQEVILQQYEILVLCFSPAYSSNLVCLFSWVNG